MTLKDELTLDPEGIGYAGMTDAEATASLNDPVRSRNRTSMTHSEVLNAIDLTELAALTAVDRESVWNVLKMGGAGLNPFGVEATIFVNAFGGGSNTITTLAAARVENISRAEEIGIRSPVRRSHVEAARS